MSVDEQARHGLYNRLVETLGPTHTRTLMEQLPPVGWADVAIKRDLDTLRHEVAASLHEAVATLRAETNAQTRLLLFGMLTVMLTAVALAFTAARFA